MIIVRQDLLMKIYLMLFVLSLSLSGCATKAEIAAREQLDAACIDGNLQACAAVQQRKSAEDLTLATGLSRH